MSSARYVAWTLSIALLSGPSVASAATVSTEDVPIVGGTAAFAQSLGISPPPDAPRFVAEMTRLIYTVAEGKSPDVDAKVQILIAHLELARKFRGSVAAIQPADGAISLTMVYREGAGSKVVLTWFDQQGKPAGMLGEPDEYANPAVSRDGTHVAVSRGSVGARNIWIVDVARNATGLGPVTFDPADDDDPVWSPDGKSIVFSSNRTGQAKLYLKAADGSGEERLMTDQPGTPTSWSKDGRFLLFTSSTPKTQGDIWVLPDPGRTAGAAKPVPVLATQFSEGQAQFSPDGRWIAYVSDESGTAEIYVRPFSPDGNSGAAGARWLVSKGFGSHPRWRADGKQLFYGVQNSLEVMAVDIDTSKGFQAGTPRRVFVAPSSLSVVAFTGWDVAPDGNRVLFAAPPNADRAGRFTVVVNWQAALKKP